MAIDHRKLELPKQPGVYLFKRSDDVLYVGKATDLRSRVRSYFVGKPDREMVPKLVGECDLVDFIVTQNPTEALVLERELIRSHQPKYNSKLRDGKSFPWIAMTSHEKPRIMYTRNVPKDAKKWGPFPDAGGAKQIVKLLRRHFGIRDSKTGKAPFGFVEEGGDQGYRDRVRAAERVLDGDAGFLIERLQSEMDDASDGLDYERAARLRDMIGSVQRAMAEGAVASRLYNDCDAIGFSSRGDSGCLVILHAKDGLVRGQSDYHLIHRQEISDSVTLVLSEHYAHRRPPRRLLVPCPLGESMEGWLSQRRGSSVEVRVPMRGELAKLREMADRNSEIHLIRSSRAGNLEKAAADEGAALLGLDTIDHVVCFDMSQSMGKERVGASIVLRKGRPAKDEYRTYRIKDGDARDDIRMMVEAVTRWAKRQDDFPDLLLLDGGMTHLSAIERALEEMGLLGKFAVASLAKREETIFMAGIDPIVLDRRGRSLIAARDEAHRFSNTYHKKSRRKSALADPLEEIEGIGAERIQALLRHFGGRKGIDYASTNDLLEVPGIGKEMAERIRAHLRR